jgi:hypothetical protein
LLHTFISFHSCIFWSQMAAEVVTLFYVHCQFSFSTP